MKAKLGYITIKLEFNSTYYCADSDSRIVKGLIAILLNAQPMERPLTEIASFDLNDYFQQLGLSGQLSPSRTNGLTALANAIKQFAAA